MTLSTRPTARSGTYLPYIDGLRAIAVLGVMVYHLRESWLPGGFSGVDVFFVISGFVVSGSVSQWRGGNFLGFLSSFYARRLQRIAPALVVCLLTTSALSMLVIPSAWLSESNDLTGLFAFFGLSNVYLALHSESYFSPSAAFNPYTHTWSLGVEEQFYLLFPLLFFAWTRGGRWRTVSSGLIVIAMTASLFDAWHRSSTDAAAGFYLVTARFWELGAGVLLYQGMQRNAGESPARKWPRLYDFAAWPCLGLLGWGLFKSDINGFPFPGAIIPVIATLGLLGCLYASGTTAPLSRLLGSRLPVHVGQRSYSLYLWHWPVYVVMRWTCGLDSLALQIVAVSVTFALAEASYRFVECPFRYSQRLGRMPRGALVAMALATVVSAWAVSTAITLARSNLSLSTVTRNADNWYSRMVPNLADVPDCFLTTRNESSGNFQVWIYGRGGCSKRPTNTSKLFVIGDSHAIGYVTLLTEYVLRTGTEVTIYPNLGCTFASLQPAREAGACVSQNEAEVADITSRAKPGDILFLAALRLDRLSNQDAILDPSARWRSMQTELAEQGRVAASAELERMLAPLVEKRIRIVFEAPKPLFRSPAFRCSDSFNVGNPVCRSGLSESRAAIEEYRQPVLDSLVRLARLLGASVWDPLPVLCGATRCDALREGRPLFFDGDHLSADGNRALYPSFVAFIESHGVEKTSARLP